MNDSDKNRILNFCLGNENKSEFEQWLYTDPYLESRIGSELYFDLVDHNYQRNDIVHEVKKSILDKHISYDEFINFKYCSILQKGGWFEGRKVEVDSIKIPETPSLNNAIKIIEEFGGLELISTYEADYWIPRNIVFPKTIERSIDGAKYGLNKLLICFAYIDDHNSVLYVDDENNYYQLDDIANIDLYRFKGKEFSNMLQNLFGLDNQDNFELVRSSNRKLKK